MYSDFINWWTGTPSPSTPPAQRATRTATLVSDDDSTPFESFASEEESVSWDLQDWAPEQSVAAERPSLNFWPGFCNASNNCWANAFLSMVVAVPSLRQIYDMVADHHLNPKVGKNLKNAMGAYNLALQNGGSVNEKASQAFRRALNCLNPDISISKHVQADAHEAFLILMGAYEDVLKSNHQPLNSKLYCSLATERHHHPKPVGVPVPGRGEPLGPNHVSTKQTDECDMLINLQGKTDYSLNHLLSKHFSNTAVDSSECGNYAISATHVQAFRLKEIKLRFCKPPEEFMLTLERFGANKRGSFKITAPVPIDRTLYLPPEATPRGERIAYALDSFIVHLGDDMQSGHYVCYKKCGENWVEADDAQVRVVTEREIDQILKGNKNSSTTYLHHFVRATGTRAPVATPPVGPTTPRPVPISFTPPCSETIAPISPPLSLDEVPEKSRKILHEIVWLHDGMPDSYRYGRKHCTQEKLDQIQEPWLIGCRGTPLLEQLSRVQMHKTKISIEEQKQTKLNELLNKLQEGTFEKKKDFEETLTQQMRNDLRRLVYEAHKKKFGEEHVHNKAKFGTDYGRVILSGDDIHNTLLEAKAPDLVGDNVVAQLANKHRSKKEQLQALYEKEQLQAYLELLKNRELTHPQLIHAFAKLEIRDAEKQMVYYDIWFASNTAWSETEQNGKSVFEKDPRCAANTLPLSINTLTEKARK